MSQENHASDSKGCRPMYEEDMHQGGPPRPHTGTQGYVNSDIMIQLVCMCV